MSVSTGRAIGLEQLTGQGSLKDARTQKEIFLSSGLAKFADVKNSPLNKLKLATKIINRE